MEFKQTYNIPQFGLVILHSSIQKFLYKAFILIVNWSTSFILQLLTTALKIYLQVVNKHYSFFLLALQWFEVLELNFSNISLKLYSVHLYLHILFLCVPISTLHIIGYIYYLHTLTGCAAVGASRGLDSEDVD